MPQSVWQKDIIKRNQAHVAARRAVTVCARCGGQPIDWHRDEHVANPTWRVCRLAHATYSLERIDAEISRCTPLCRRCHMTVDGRLKRLEKILTERNATSPVERDLTTGRYMRRTVNDV